MMNYNKLKLYIDTSVDRPVLGFKAVAYMREVCDQISNEIKDMNFAELKKYYEQRRLKLTCK